MLICKKSSFPWDSFSRKIEARCFPNWQHASTLFLLQTSDFSSSRLSNVTTTITTTKTITMMSSFFLCCQQSKFSELIFFNIFTSHARSWTQNCMLEVSYKLDSSFKLSTVHSDYYFTILFSFWTAVKYSKDQRAVVVRLS